MQSVTDRIDRATWWGTLTGRRSRRFMQGMKMLAGPLAYASQRATRPLTLEEEAALAFAAAGITGHALADLCYARGEGGNIMNGFVGRAAGSGDGIQAVAMFVINDQGAWLIKRPRDFQPTEIDALLSLARSKALSEIYQQSRVQVKSGRVSPPNEPLYNINCNRWSAQAPGTTCFLPVNDLTFLYINGLLEIFNETTGAYVVDERAGFRPAGVARFARSRGGHLHDDLREGRVATIELVERLVTEFVTIEQGMMLQNLSLMTQALGLGGFPNFANHEFGWFEALGFKMGSMPASRYLGVGPVASLGLRLLRRDVPVPFPIGLEVGVKTWLKSWSPPFYASMSDAVMAVVEAKIAAFRQAMEGGAWKTEVRISEENMRPSERAIAATTAYCEYVWERYGRFPAYLAPFRTVVAYQAGHVDVDFYDRYYRPEALTETQRRDFAETVK